MNKNLIDAGGGIVFAAPHSASGKTLLITALIRHYSEQKIPIAAGKSGPDYIDPLFHRFANPDAPTLNLDSWAMRPDSLHAIVQLAQEKILLVEGAMGLFDGAASGEHGSTAHLAESLDLPIVLILPAKTQARSLAAQLYGFIHYRETPSIAGIILNGTGSDSHAALLTDILTKDFPDLPILGAVPWQQHWQVPSRHLGLVTPNSLADFDRLLHTISQEAARFIDTKKNIENGKKN